MFGVDDDDDNVDDDSSLDMIYLASKPYFRVGKMIALQTMKIKVEKTFIDNNNTMYEWKQEETQNKTNQQAFNRETERERWENVICNENK